MSDNPARPETGNHPPCLTFLGPRGNGYRDPKPYFPVRKEAKIISREEAMAARGCDINGRKIEAL